MNEMKPGRELDALIDEKVMGQPPFAKQVLDILKEHIPGNGGCLGCGRDDDSKECLPHYSTDIADAWQVVRKLYELGHNTHVYQLKDGKFEVHCFIGRRLGPGVIGLSESAPHAICLAALKAVGIE